MKLPVVRRKNININANFLLDKWIWISLAIAFGVAIILFTSLFTLWHHNQINLSIAIIVVISIIPFIIFITYWVTTSIVFRLIFKSITKEIEKDAVFPFASSVLLKEEEISVKKYIQKGNLQKIKGYKAGEFKLLLYMSIILILFILFNFLFVGLTQLNVIDISESWLYLFGLLANIISLILSAVFGFMVSNAINAPIQFELKYKNIKDKIYEFKIFLNVNDLKKVDYHELRYRNANFLPIYFYQALLISSIRKEQYLQELEHWKYYLNLSSYLNQFSWLLYLYYIINNKDLLPGLKKRKYMRTLSYKIRKVHRILFYTENDYLYFNEKYDAKQLEEEYNDLLGMLNKYGRRFSLRMITTSLERNGLKITKTINAKKDENIIDERDLDINLYQLNYLEYLFSIAFVTEQDYKSREHFKY